MMQKEHWTQDATVSWLVVSGLRHYLCPTRPRGTQLFEGVLGSFEANMARNNIVALLCLIGRSRSETRRSWSVSARAYVLSRHFDIRNHLLERREHEPWPVSTASSSCLVFLSSDPSPKDQDDLRGSGSDCANARPGGAKPIVPRERDTQQRSSLGARDPTPVS